MVNKNSSQAQKIAVIGGGIIGLCIALKLQMNGEKVTIFEKDNAGEGCSKGNAGHFATEQIFPLATPALIPQLPKMLLSPSSPVSIRFQDIHKTMPWMIRFLMKARKSATEHATQALTELNHSAMESWQRLLEEIGLSHLIVDEGSLLVFEDSQLFSAYQSTLNAMDEQGVSYQVWDRNTVREKVPKLSHSVNHGVFFPKTSHSLSPYDMCVELKSYFQGLLGEWSKGEVENIQEKDEKMVVTVQERSQSFDKVIVATGAESASLVKQMTGIKVPLQAERGYHLMMPDLAKTLPFPVSSADRKFIMTPMQNGLRLAGTVEYADLNSPANMRRATMLKDLAKSVLNPECNLENTGTSWMGNRPSLPDSLPVIDSLKNGKMLFAFGHQHLGLTQAAVTADLIVQLHRGEQPHINLAPFCLNRFG
ncbi:NAD(P)/FAD-dependent oxidoreductase [Vibrio coralliilyticus]|uniref:NAD(P)/FAD-dependent oxidoreductase n=1 Tax=Vibrio coralliilyticus TaxID=190893 RepID=UPI003916D258